MFLLDHYRLWQVGLLQKLIFLLFLSLLVFGEDEEDTLVVNNVVISPHDKQSPGLHAQNQLNKRSSLKHSFDALFSSKRKVPNAADPLHNR
ncbi:hypothetical protein TIFTF001_005050 [Ficus carica]|uniref:Uncharacterized protein n=1 Tax=Ficus carica TaxID=3494 RepID=A0AA88CU48_FICCA|nr:hypothetical protein TIFTF001_005050 [Ficus carica]